MVQNGSCATLNSAATTVTVDPLSVGGTVTGGTTPITLGQSTGTMTLGGYTGTIVKWQERLGSGSWVDVINTTSTFADSPNAVGTWEFRAVVQSGTCSVSNSASLFITVNTSSEGAVTGGTTPICLGSSTTTMTLAGYTGSIVKWQKHVDGGSWIDINNTTTTYSEIPATAGTWEYRVIVHNISDLPSAPASIVVNPVSVGGTVTGGTTICAGSPSGQLSLTGQTGTVVKWQSSVSPFTTWTDIANAATTYTSGILSETTLFRAIVQSGVCSTTNSSPSTVTVTPVSVGGILSSGVSQIYLGQSSGAITLSGQTGMVIKWQERLNGGAWLDVANATTTYTDTEASVGVWEYRAVVQSGSCSTANSSTVSINVLSSVAGGVTGGNTPICLGSSTGTMTLSGYTGTVVKWQKRLTGGTWSDIANTADTYSEIPSSVGSWEYRAVVHNAADMYSIQTIIDVNASSVGGTITGGTNICAGNTSGLLTLAGQTGNVVKWQSSVSPFTSWTDITNTATTYTSAVLAQTTQFRAVLQSGSCAAVNSLPVTVTVNPATSATITGSSTVTAGSSGMSTVQKPA